MKKLEPNAVENRYTVTQLTHGKSREVFGKVEHARAVVTVIHNGKPIALIVPIDAQVSFPHVRSLTDPAAAMSSTPALTDPTASITTKDT